jgi:bifunctional DNase/RNase
VVRIHDRPLGSHSRVCLGLWPCEGRVAQGTERWPSKPMVAGSNPAAPVPREGRLRIVQEMTVYGVSYDSVGRQPIVLLRTSDGRRVLPIWIGSGEANAILTKLKGSDPPRPMTHDLLQSLVDLVGASVLRVSVTALRDNTYYAVITLRINGEDVDIDSRPSDAIALAVRADAPIFAAEEVIEESAVEAERPPSEQQVVEDFRRFLDELSPDDFLRDE